MLKGKGNADDGQRKGEAQGNVADENPESCQGHPQEIAKKSQGTWVMRLKHLAKRRQRQACKLEALETERDPNDRKAEEKTGQKIFKGGQKTATEYRPNQVEKKIQQPTTQSKGW